MLRHARGHSSIRGAPCQGSSCSHGAEISLSHPSKLGDPPSTPQAAAAWLGESQQSPGSLCLITKYRIKILSVQEGVQDLVLPVMMMRD